MQLPDVLPPDGMGVAITVPREVSFRVESRNLSLLKAFLYVSA